VSGSLWGSQGHEMKLMHEEVCSSVILASKMGRNKKSTMKPSLTDTSSKQQTPPNSVIFLGTELSDSVNLRIADGVSVTKSVRYLEVSLYFENTVKGKGRSKYRVF